MNTIHMTILATLFTWGMTALGASSVFFFKNVRKQILNIMLGFASGVMIAASFWSLLSPAIEMAEQSNNLPSYLIVTIGFISGALFLWGSDKLYSSFSKNIQSRHSLMLFFSITLHNIPEGLAIGVAFGALQQNASFQDLLEAIAVAFGIGIQNFPEGAAVSIPLRKENLSRWKCFLYGQASGVVEPIAGLLGVLLVSYVQPILPYALAFAAGAMINVVAEELIPEAQQVELKENHLATAGVIIGFCIMMILDVALG